MENKDQNCDYTTLPRVQVEKKVGDKTVGTETDWLLGPIEGKWWRKYSWWVIPLGFLLLVWPGWLHEGIKWLSSYPTTTITPETSHSQSQPQKVEVEVKVAPIAPVQIQGEVKVGGTVTSVAPPLPSPPPSTLTPPQEPEPVASPKKPKSFWDFPENR